MHAPAGSLDDCVQLLDEPRIHRGLRIEREDERALRGGRLLEGRAPQIRAQIHEARAAERESRERRVHRQVIVDEWQAGPLGEQRANRVLSRCDRAVDEDDVHLRRCWP